MKTNVSKSEIKKITLDNKGENKNKAKNDKITLEPVKQKDNSAIRILNKSGLVDGYKYVLSSLCKNGLPKGNVFEYAAYSILNYEKKLKEIKSKQVKEMLNKYWQDHPEKKDKLNRSVSHRSRSQLDISILNDPNRSKSARKKVKTDRSKSPKIKIENLSPINKNDTKNSQKKIPETKTTDRNNNREASFEKDKEPVMKKDKRQNNTKAKK